MKPPSYVLTLPNEWGKYGIFQPGPYFSMFLCLKNWDNKFWNWSNTEWERGRHNSLTVWHLFILRPVGTVSERPLRGLWQTQLYCSVDIFSDLDAVKSKTINVHTIPQCIIFQDTSKKNWKKMQLASHVMRIHHEYWSTEQYRDFTNCRAC